MTREYKSYPYAWMKVYTPARTIETIHGQDRDATMAEFDDISARRTTTILMVGRSRDIDSAEPVKDADPILFRVMPDEDYKAQSDTWSLTQFQEIVALAADRPGAGVELIQPTGHLKGDPLLARYVDSWCTPDMYKWANSIMVTPENLNIAVAIIKGVPVEYTPAQLEEQEKRAAQQAEERQRLAAQARAASLSQKLMTDFARATAPQIGRDFAASVGSPEFHTLPVPDATNHLPNLGFQAPDSPLGPCF